MHYYLRNNANEIVATIALIREDGHWNRGISVRSYLDNPKKETGRTIAINRAKGASEFEKRTNNCFNIKKILKVMDSVTLQEHDLLHIDLWVKSACNVILSEYESYLINRYYKREMEDEARLS